MNSSKQSINVTLRVRTPLRLAAVLFPALAITLLGCGGTGIIDQAMHMKIRNDSAFLALQVRRYENDVQPLKAGQGLTVLAESPSGNPQWKAVAKDRVLDPWKNPYIIRIGDDGSKQVWSLGADGKAGGSGKGTDFDIRNAARWPTWLKAAAARNKNK